MSRLKIWFIELAVLVLMYTCFMTFEWTSREASLRHIAQPHDSQDVAAPCPSPPNMVNVVLGADRRNFVGALSTINSLVDTVRNSPNGLEHLRVFYFTNAGDLDFYRSLFFDKAKLVIPHFHLLPLPNLTFSSKTTIDPRFAQQDRNLNTYENYARLFIDVVLADFPDVVKLIWIDTDVIVTRDPAPFFHGVLNGPSLDGDIMAAFAENRPRSYTIMFTYKEALQAIAPGGAACAYEGVVMRKEHRDELRPDVYCPHFNAGVLAMRVDRWRARNVTARAMELLAADAVSFHLLDRPLWEHVSNPPLVLLAQQFGMEMMAEPVQFHFRMDHMDDKSLHDLRSQALKRNPYFIHYHGETKPWHRDASCRRYGISEFFELNAIGLGCSLDDVTNGKCKTLRQLGYRKLLSDKVFDRWCGKKEPRLVRHTGGWAGTWYGTDEGLRDKVLNITEVQLKKAKKKAKKARRRQRRVDKGYGDGEDPRKAKLLSKAQRRVDEALALSAAGDI